MQDLIDAIYKSLESENWYSALITSLILPDICGRIQYPNMKSKGRYIQWFNHYLLGIYKNFLTAPDCYALRCSYLHDGSDNILDQKARKILDYFVFTTTPSHCNYFNVNGETFLQLNVKQFCNDICTSAEKWLEDVSNDLKVQERISKLLKIKGSDGVLLGNGIFIN